MYEEEAVELITSQFGSLQNFAMELVAVQPSITKGDYNSKKLSKKLKVSPLVIERALTSKGFRKVMRQLVAMHMWRIEDEQQHIQIIKRKATATKASVDSLIKAREHLGRLMGDSLDEPERITTGIQINFGSPDVIDAEVIEVSHEGRAEYKPAKAGDLPPDGARKKYSGELTSTTTLGGIPVGSALDFYTEDSPYEATSGNESESLLGGDD